VESSATGHGKDASRLRRFDFWLLAGISAGAYLGIYFSEFGLTRIPKGFSIAFFSISLGISALVAYAGSIVPRKADLPVFPIFERLPSLTTPAVIYPVAVGLAVAIIASLVEREYFHLLFGWFGRIAFKRSGPHRLNAFGAVTNSIAEELLFRGFLLPLLVAFIHWVWETPIKRKTIAICVANLIQSLAFGDMKLYLGIGGLYTLPRYTRVLLLGQTWLGLVLGFVYLTYGLESAIICHATYDLLVLAQMRRIIRLPTFF
jgi:membrane protease YdiL (CAAX protease family)